MHRAPTTLAILALAAGLLVSGCGRGLPRDQRQLDVIPDMEVQKKFKAQDYTTFFADGRVMRTPVAGTVAQGSLREDEVFYRGAIDTNFVAHAPMVFTREMMRRGQNRFNIYCAPCHDQTGGGRGLVIKRGSFPPPPHLWDERVVNHPDGKIYDIISNGIRTMPAYGHQIVPEDRWALVAYVRALQRAETATLDDVPDDKVREIR